MPGIRQPALPLRELFGSPLVGRGRLSPSSPSRASPAASRRCWRRPARGKPLPAPSGDLPSSARVSAASVPKLSQVIDAPCEHLVTRSATDATDVIKLHNHRLFFFFFFSNTSIFLQKDLHIFCHPLCMKPPAAQKGIYFRIHYRTLALQCLALYNVITIDSLNLPPFPLSELILQKKISKVHCLDPSKSLKAEVLPLCF